ncbi:MAG: ABC transporter permease [Kiritimatiellia bacterium]
MLFPTLLGISFIAFLITRVVPGGPVEQAMTQARQAALKGGIRGAGGNDALSPEQVQQLKKMYGLDRPVLIAYLEWLGVKPKPVTGEDGKDVRKFAGVLQGDFGISFREGEPVTEVIKRRLPISATFGLLTTLIVYSTCIPLGILKAMKHRSPFDNASSVSIFVGYAIPGYVLATVLMYLFCFKWQIFPNSGFQARFLARWGPSRNCPTASSTCSCR